LLRKRKNLGRKFTQKRLGRKEARSGGVEKMIPGKKKLKPSPAAPSTCSLSQKQLECAEKPPSGGEERSKT